MTNPERQKTIEYLKRFVFLMEDRPDGDRLKEPIDSIKAEIRRLESFDENRVEKSTEQPNLSPPLPPSREGHKGG